MALSSKDWQFIFAVVEHTAVNMYDSGYKDGVAKKTPVKNTAMRLTPAHKLQLQTLYTQQLNQGH